MLTKMTKQDLDCHSVLSPTAGQRSKEAECCCIVPNCKPGFGHRTDAKIVRFCSQSCAEYHVLMLIPKYKCSPVQQKRYIPYIHQDTLNNHLKIMAK